MVIFSKILPRAVLAGRAAGGDAYFTKLCLSEVAETRQHLTDRTPISLRPEPTIQAALLRLPNP